MTRLVLVHGMRQEGKDPEELRRAWMEALDRAWGKLALRPTFSEVALPYYGDELHKLSEAVRQQGQVTLRAGDPGLSPEARFEEQVLAELAANAGVSDAEIEAAYEPGVRERGVQHWEWVQAVARALERRFPSLGRYAMSLVPQVHAYLTRPHIGNAVDAIVRPELSKGPCVVIAHSLGTVVGYRNLVALADRAQVRLLVTLGSPLGIETVKTRLRPPALCRPAGVAAWVNGTDERDCVALRADLTETSFAKGIDNHIDIRNAGDDPHAIAEYLSEPRIARRIAEAA